MSSRYLENHNTRQVPQYLQEFIRMRGGETPFGESRYRVIWGSDRFEQVGGEWLEWDESLGVNDRNYQNRKGEALNKPRRIVEDLRYVHKYPTQDKWILEKWMPPESFGDPETWYKAVSPSGKYPLLGKYPSEGDYESTGYEFPNEALTQSILASAIGRIEHLVDSLPSTAKGRALRVKYAAEKRNEAKELALEKKQDDIVGETGWAFNGKPFMALSGDKRQSDRDRTAEKLGLSLNNIN